MNKYIQPDWERGLQSLKFALYNIINPMALGEFTEYELKTNVGPWFLYILLEYYYPEVDIRLSDSTIYLNNIKITKTENGYLFKA